MTKAELKAQIDTVTKLIEELKALRAVLELVYITHSQE